MARGHNHRQRHPTKGCVESNARALALYATFCQDQGLVPIVEPEVLIDGDHSLEECYKVTEWTLHATFRDLYEHNVEYSGMLLKPNMVIPGKNAERRAGVEGVARATVDCLLRTVPAAVPGIVFLSGGQGVTQATAHLNAMNTMHQGLPWELSFSYARALQEPPMEDLGRRSRERRRGSEGLLPPPENERGGEKRQLFGGDGKRSRLR